jgi:hypothetical protein
MIILFGSRAGHLKTLRIPVLCRNCKTSDCVELIAYQRFAHIFWIPIFPTRKIFTSQCSHCKDALIEDEVKASYPQAYQETRKKLFVPFWSFTGIAVVAGFILFISIVSYIRTVKNQFMIQSPESGDIYRYITKDGAYSLLKVSEVRGDTVYVFTNNYATKSIRSLSKLRDDSYFSFSKELSPILRSDLIQMFESGEINEIERE